MLFFVPNVLYWTNYEHIPFYSRSLFYPCGDWFLLRFQKLLCIKIQWQSINDPAFPIQYPKFGPMCCQVHLGFRNIQFLFNDCISSSMIQFDCLCKEKSFSWFICGIAIAKVTTSKILWFYKFEIGQQFIEIQKCYVGKLHWIGIFEFRFNHALVSCLQTDTMCKTLYQRR